MKFFILTLLIFLCVGFRASAAEPAIVEIDKIIITADATSIDKNSTHSQNITLKATKPTSQSVADVLVKQPGVHIRRYGGIESDASVSIRGSSHDQVLVVLDDIPLETASGDGVGLGQIPVTALTKIEIYKTFTPSDFGGAAVGGVINLKSKKIEKGFHHRHGFGFGSFTTLNALSEISHGGDTHDFLFGMDYRRAGGNFSFLDDNGTPVNTADDTTTTRQNNEQQIIHPYFKWLHRLDDRTDLSFTTHVFRTDAGVPGLGSFQSTTTDLSTTEILTGLKLTRRDYFNGTTTFTNNTTFRFIKSQFSDPNAEIGLGTAQDNDNTTTVFTDRFTAKTEFSKRFSMKNGLEYLHEYFLPKDYLATPSVGSTSLRHQFNIFSEPHVKIGKRVEAFFQIKSLNAFYNINDNDPSLAAPATFASSRTENQFSATAALHYEPAECLKLKASGGRVVRLPKFVEMFGDQGFVLGNPQLVSEKSYKFDLGATHTKKFEGVVKKISSELNYFESHLSDLIQFEQTSGFARASNIGDATIRGVEAAAVLDVTDFVTLSANYTFQHATDDASGNYLVGRPKHEVNLEVLGHVKNLELGVSTNFIDDQYLDGLNTQRVDNRLVVNANAAYTLKAKYRFSVAANNLSDSRVVDAIGFPLPGRSFFGRVDVIF